MRSLSRAAITCAAAAFSTITLAAVGTVIAGVPANAADPLPTQVASAPKCTINGTAGADTLRGTTGNDVICGLGGNDTLIGSAGNDWLIGGAGRDKLDAGDGRDTLRGEAGVDTLLGGAGNDSLQGGSGTDQLTSGAGADVCAVDPADSVSDACPSDSNGPAISNIQAPSIVSAGSTLSVTWSVSDEAGVAASTFFIAGPNNWVTWCGFGQAGQLISGTSTAGGYRATCTLPSSAINQDYSIWITAIDVFGNTSAPTTVTGFSVAGGNGDSESPVISDTVTPQSVRPGDQMVLRWRATDASGIANDDAGRPLTMAWVAAPNGRFSDDFGVYTVNYGDFDVRRVSGTATNGVYEITVTVPTNAIPGTYTVWYSARDILDNRDFDTAVLGRTQPVTFRVL